MNRRRGTANHANAELAAVAGHEEKRKAGSSGFVRPVGEAVIPDGASARLILCACLPTQFYQLSTCHATTIVKSRLVLVNYIFTLFFATFHST